MFGDKYKADSDIANAFNQNVRGYFQDLNCLYNSKVGIGVPAHCQCSVSARM